MSKRALLTAGLLVILLFSSKLSANDHFGMGFGLTTDNYSVSESNFTAPVLHMYYELEGSNFAAVTLSYYGLNVYFPVVALDAGLIVEIVDSLSLKASVGYFTDLTFAGHMGLMVTGSVIVNKTLELKIFGTPTGLFSQPGYSITGGVVNGSFIKNENGLYDLQRGYVGILVCMRF